MNILKFISSAMLFFILCACGDKFKFKHRVEVWHNTNANDVFLNELVINNEKIKDINNIRLKKRDRTKKESFEKKIQFASIDDNLEVKASLILDGKKKNVQCKIQTEGQYCVLRMIYVESGNFHCTCDGMYL